ncbi:hypothetical protein NLM27_33395 [Bradyrhizobium sp. CCGB12]|uniref:hypothetical protein n=1 Tax=Bradyrhizobium sp. CCGB12 TaxID=2949632 RepID=UPI0020B3CADB|nr:hypothetical protein [Bradyrhizobium sp. CCGB12]MCP3393657.1 hypothetical protein [Bradyrhizobium sp. CCGB12]
MTGQVVGQDNGAGTTDRRAWLRISGLVILAAAITAIVASRSIESSQLHGRLSVPPLYDDVAYFLDAVRWTNAAKKSGTSACDSQRTSWKAQTVVSPWSNLLPLVCGK